MFDLFDDSDVATESAESLGRLQNFQCGYLAKKYHAIIRVRRIRFTVILTVPDSCLASFYSEIVQSDWTGDQKSFLCHGS
jgi:hypothetical protein